MWGEYLIFNRT